MVGWIGRIKRKGAEGVVRGVYEMQHSIQQNCEEEGDEKPGKEMPLNVAQVVETGAKLDDPPARSPGLLVNVAPHYKDQIYDRDKQSIFHLP